MVCMSHRQAGDATRATDSVCAANTRLPVVHHHLRSTTVLLTTGAVGAHEARTRVQRQAALTRVRPQH